MELNDVVGIVHATVEAAYQKIYPETRKRDLPEWAINVEQLIPRLIMDYYDAYTYEETPPIGLESIRQELKAEWWFFCREIFRDLGKDFADEIEKWAVQTIVGKLKNIDTEFGTLIEEALKKTN